ncbi:hypothetical protein ACHAQI_004625 [Fusarium lateritium]
MATATVKDFIGMKYSREGSEYAQEDYKFLNEQCATSSHGVDHDMKPAHILKPKDDDDVKSAITYAHDNKLDLSNTYKDMKIVDKPAIPVPDDRVLVFAGVSNQLQDFLAYLTNHGLFLPTGQCAYVCLGGHGQTGGYGQLGRSFGLLATKGNVLHINKDENPELFYAIRGGSPGNFGIITHYTIMAFKARSYMGIGNTINTPNGPTKFQGPHGAKDFWLYNEKTLTSLLNIVAAMSDQGTAPRGFDLCVNVLSTDFDITKLFPSFKNDKVWKGLQSAVSSFFPDSVLALLRGKLPPVIVLYAQWCPVGGQQKYDESVDAWFQQFRALDTWDLGCVHFDEFSSDMAQMVGHWLFPQRREFPRPYVKRTYSTNSNTLGKDGWVKNLVNQLGKICNPYEKLDDANENPVPNDLYDNCKLSAQI